MTKDTKNDLKSLPAVDAVLKLAGTAALIERCGRTETVDAIRTAIDGLRDSMRRGGSIDSAACEASSVLSRAAQFLENSQQANLKRVVNATGIILHTGLGRAVMPDAAREALSSLTGCCNIQMDLETGKRIKREKCIRDLVVSLTGAEDVLVVNNNVGATLLVLRALAVGKEVIVSRGELIEIGGSFRLPDTMTESGAILREVGTTNKTHLYDYEKAVCPDTGLILKVHKSNYRIVGFTDEVGIEQLAELGKRHGIPVVDDLGCGALVGLEQYGMEHEMTVRESLQAGADIVLFSTDKLIGGPQGGMIVGRQDLLDLIRAHPLYRALRVCKMTLAALESTLRLFKAPELLPRRHPTYMMITKSLIELETQACDLVKLISERQPDWDVSVTKEVSYLGGGSLPGSELQSFAVKITAGSVSAEEIARRFRTAAVPVIPRVKDDAVLLDMRTVFAEEMDDVVKACTSAASGVRPIIMNNESQQRIVKIRHG